MCAQRAKEQRCGASTNVSKHARVHIVIEVSVMIGLNE